MNLITARCPDCGADLKIPEGSSTVTCEFCGSQVIVTDILGTSAVMQNCMTLAYAALESKDYKDAYGHFNSALEIDMKNYSAWFGKAICTGMTGKLIDLRINEMIKLFENAFNYAPADKQANMRRNASAEIVKAIKALMQVFKLQQDMLSMTGIDDGDMRKGLEDASNKVKQEFSDALNKAREYDPSNADITPLQNEIAQASQEAEKPLTVQTPAGQTPLEMFQSADEELKKINTPPVSQQPSVNEKKKSGCMSIIAMFIVIAGSFFLCSVFVL